jgi:hypothetical protein
LVAGAGAAKAVVARGRRERMVVMATILMLGEDC